MYFDLNDKKEFSEAISAKKERQSLTTDSSFSCQDLLCSDILILDPYSIKEE